MIIQQTASGLTKYEIPIMSQQNELLNKIINRLNQFVDFARIDNVKKYCPTSMQIMGLSVPDMRIVLKEFSPVFNEMTSREVIDLGKALAETRILEIQQFAYDMISKDKRLVEELNIEDLEVFEKNLDNWASVDCFSLFLTGQLWRTGKVDIKWIKKWGISDNYWHRRVAVVSTVALNLKSKGGTGDTKQTLEICEMLKADKADLVRKGLSWALRELVKRDKEAVIEFMQRNDSFLAGRVKKEVWNKIEKGTKN